MSHLKEILNAINKKYGEGTVIYGTDSSLVVNRQCTDVLAIDLAVGGGLPESSIIEVFGNEQSGKTTLALKTVAAIQKRGGIAAYIDLENALDYDWVSKLGVDTDTWIHAQPNCAETAIDILDSLVRSRELSVVVFDSVAAAIPSEEIDKSASNQQMALVARLMSKMMRKLHSALQPENLGDKSTYNKCIVLLINQLREKVGLVFGNPYVSPGGRAIKFGARVRIRLMGGEWIAKDKEIIGRVIKFKIVKNKTFKPEIAKSFNLYFDGTIDNIDTVIAEALRFGLITRGGAYYTYNSNKFLGKDELRRGLLENQTMMDSLVESIKQVTFPNDSDSDKSEKITEQVG